MDCEESTNSGISSRLSLGYNQTNEFTSPLIIKEDDESDDEEYLELFASFSSSKSDIISTDESTSYMSSESLDILDLANNLHATEVEMERAHHGYTFHEKVCDTVQGELWIGETISGEKVAIKVIDSELHFEKRSREEEDGLTFLVEQDVEREADILETLCADTKTSQGIVRYIDFFELDSTLNLVMEYIDGVTMEEFILTAHQYIEEGRMRHYHWANTVQQIIYQIITTINRLHRIHKCCHLGL